MILYTFQFTAMTASINAGVRTTQSPQQPTEVPVSLLFENVLITFVIVLLWIFASDWILQPDQMFTSIAAGNHIVYH